MSISPLNKWVPGALSKGQLTQLCKPGWIEDISDENDPIDYSAIDLTLSDEGYQMLEGCIKPFGETYDQILNNKNFAKPLGKRPHYLLEPKQTYVFRLNERLGSKLLTSKEIYGQATARSSVGRVDVLARLIVDGMNTYEGFAPDDLHHPTGQMYLEITSITFRVRVKPGIALSQLRLFYGKPCDCEISARELFGTVLQGSTFQDGSLSVDLKNDPSIGGCAFRATSNQPDVIPLWRGATTNTKKLWSLMKSDQVPAESGPKNSIRLKKNAFHILLSKEKISLPGGIAVYCRAIDETIGEMRIHYAGFVHPFFGRERDDGQTGTPLIFEVRGHDVKVTLTDGEKMARLTFYRMSEDCKPPKQKLNRRKSGYENQKLKLSGFFSPCEWL
ncbi:MAG: 2'-deoxycytidine 5'-triphosphate deaminase [Verrucomicrobia bacterium]|nr:2'-deoxycytidine 5'-triphosphate deaminase [Verrucomicrobiota bacterium]